MATRAEPDLQIDAGRIAGRDRAAEPVMRRAETPADLVARLRASNAIIDKAFDDALARAKAEDAADGDG